MKEQTYLDLGYAEQLYTFGDRGRHLVARGEGPRLVSVGYLALTRQSGTSKAPDTLWRNWYRYFPWEDWRKEEPAVIADVIAPALRSFVRAASDQHTAERRRERMRLCFGLDGLGWDEEKVLERYELLYEAGLVPEAARDGADEKRSVAWRSARRGHDVRSSPHPCDRHRAVARQVEIPPRRVRADAGVIHPARTATHGRSTFGNSPAQAEFPPIGRGPGPGSSPGDPEIPRPRRAAGLQNSSASRREVLRERPAPGVRLGARGRVPSGPDATRAPAFARARVAILSRLVRSGHRERMDRADGVERARTVALYEWTGAEFVDVESQANRPEIDAGTACEGPVEASAPEASGDRQRKCFRNEPFRVRAVIRLGELSRP